MLLPVMAMLVVSMLRVSSWSTARIDNIRGEEHLEARPAPVRMDDNDGVEAKVVVPTATLLDKEPITHTETLLRLRFATTTAGQGILLFALAEDEATRQQRYEQALALAKEIRRKCPQVKFALAINQESSSIANAEIQQDSSSSSSLPLFTEIIVVDGQNNDGNNDNAETLLWSQRIQAMALSPFAMTWAMTTSNAVSCLAGLDTTLENIDNQMENERLVWATANRALERHFFVPNLWSILYRQEPRGAGAGAGAGADGDQKEEESGHHGAAQQILSDWWSQLQEKQSSERDHAEDSLVLALEQHRARQNDEPDERQQHLAEISPNLALSFDLIHGDAQNADIQSSPSSIRQSRMIGTVSVAMVNSEGLSDSMKRNVCHRLNAYDDARRSGIIVQNPPVVLTQMHVVYGPPGVENSVKEYGANVTFQTTELPWDRKKHHADDEALLTSPIPPVLGTKTRAAEARAEKTRLSLETDWKSVGTCRNVSAARSLDDDDVWIREYLNYLTKKSMSKKDPGRQVSYLKTHKTASTTTGSILFRFNARHRLRTWRGTHILSKNVPFWNKRPNGVIEPVYPVGAVPCNNTDVRQQWTVHKLADVGHTNNAAANNSTIVTLQLQSSAPELGSNQCLNISGGVFEMNACNGTAAGQQFRLVDGQLRTSAGRCVVLHENEGPAVVSKICDFVDESVVATIAANVTDMKQTTTKQVTVMWPGAKGESTEGTNDQEHPQLCLTSSNSEYGQGFLHHISPYGDLFSDGWNDAMHMLQSAVPHGALVTNFREPISHHKSWYLFYKGDSQTKNLTDLFGPNTGGFRVPRNTLAMEFGVYGPQQIERFLADKVLDRFEMILQSERLDEGLVAMRRMFGWDMIDITYLTLRGSDQKVRKSRVKKKDNDLDDKVRQVTQLDQKMYNVGLEHYEATMRKAGDITDDLEEFQCLQALIRTYCGTMDMYGWGSAGCVWYSLIDVVYQQWIQEYGYIEVKYF